MNELEQILIGDGAASSPAVILEGIPDARAHRVEAGAPRTIYEELWHIAFWREMTLDWIAGIETPYPVHAVAGFPTKADTGREDWNQLRERFFAGNRRAATAAQDGSTADKLVRCPSRPGLPVRTMTVREQLENLERIMPTTLGGAG